MHNLPTDAFIFMKVGRHADEDFKDILARKRREYEVAGRTFWGYGGTVCHPLRHVQPFARLHLSKQGGLYLLMETIDSHADPDLMPATEYSDDGIAWRPIPKGISVIGSRYALILDEINPTDLEISLNQYSVAVGPSRGKSAGDYVKGRVDKACLELTQTPDRPSDIRGVHRIGYTARILDPFAVMLR